MRAVNISHVSKHNMLAMLRQERCRTLTERMRKERELSPTVSDYAALLSMAQKQFGIDRDAARERYGSFDYGQWADLLEGRA